MSRSAAARHRCSAARHRSIAHRRRKPRACQPPADRIASVRGIGANAAAAAGSRVAERLAHLLAHLEAGSADRRSDPGAAAQPWPASVATVASSTPAASPRQPAWATATALPSSAANSTGRQSATSTASTRPGCRRHRRIAPRRHLRRAASEAPGPRPPPCVPCTCYSHSGSARQLAVAAQLAPVAPHRLGVIADVPAQIEDA